MLKFANQIIDAYDDISKDLLTKLASQNPTCYMMTPEERMELKDHEFGLSVITKKASKLNKFPINSADSTWLSAQYFDANHHKLPHGAAKLAAFNIKKACDKFGVAASDAVSSHAELQKEASSNVYFENEKEMRSVVVSVRPDLSKIAMVEEVANNHTHAQYAMPRPEHVKVACKYLEDNAAKIPLELRHKYAAAIQKRAHELGMGAQKGFVQKYASDHYSGSVDAHIRARSSLLDGRPELKSTVEKIGSAKKNFSPSEFAQMLHGFDKQAGLSRYYGAGLTDPYIATFASEPDPYEGYRVKVAGQTVNNDDLQRVVNAKYAQIKEYFGANFADEMKKHPTAIFDSLPRDAKELIVGMIDGTH